MNKVSIRIAEESDSSEITGLLDELGYSDSEESVRSRIEKLSKIDNDVITVAEMEGKVVGIAHLHIAELLHEEGKLGRIMAIVISESHHNLGIGKELMNYLEEIAKKQGCIKMEVTSSFHRSEAHRFYRGLGYTESPRRFIKKL